MLVVAGISVVSNAAMLFAMLRVRGLVLGRMASGIAVVVPVRERAWDRVWRRLQRTN